MLTTANKKERRLLIQALVSGSPCFFMMTFHHLIHFPLLELLSGELCVGIDPIVYLWFNREIRADFFELIDETLKKFGIKNLGRLSNTVAAMTSTQARHRLGNLEIGHMKNTVDNIDPPLRSLQD
uniref:Uncharacterized protein n=1 Tax=Acrobeloides nanus TaxID=290746 RepID=A0A914DFL4_9BILA